jgi:hypothetical protein
MTILDQTPEAFASRAHDIALQIQQAIAAGKLCIIEPARYRFDNGVVVSGFEYFGSFDSLASAYSQAQEIAAVSGALGESIPEMRVVSMGGVHPAWETVPNPEQEEIHAAFDRAFSESLQSSEASGFPHPICI